MPEAIFLSMVVMERSNTHAYQVSPKTAVQSSGPFSPGTTWFLSCAALAGYGCSLASLPHPSPSCQLLNRVFGSCSGL